MSTTKDMMQYDLLADLVAAPVTAGATAFFAGRTVIGDGQGGLYRWDASSTATEDTKFLNVVASSVSSAGRWIRVFQRARVLPHGILVMNGGVKTFFASGVTAADGTVSLSLTMDNTAGGEAIFTEIWSNTSIARTVSTTPGGAVQSFLVEEAANLKSTKHGFCKANVLTLALGLLYNPFIMVGAGVNVRTRVEGV